MDLIRHVGKIKNTGIRCVVVFRKMPGEGSVEDRDHALVIHTDSLPDAYHENLIRVVESQEAQQTHNLYELLARRSFVDGAPMLETMHRRGYLQKEKVENVILFPMPNQPLPLRDANNAIDNYVDKDPADAWKADAPKSTPLEGEEGQNVAMGLIAQAELLEAEAQAKREQAYTMVPSLRPDKGRRELSPEEKQRSKAETNRKRREKYAAEKKTEEAASKPATKAKKAKAE